MPVSYRLHAKRDTGRERGREGGVILGALWDHFGTIVGTLVEKGGEEEEQTIIRSRWERGKNGFGLEGAWVQVRWFHAGFAKRGWEREGSGIHNKRLFGMKSLRSQLPPLPPPRFHVAVSCSGFMLVSCSGFMP